MSKELQDLLAKLNTNVEQLNRGTEVAKAAGIPAAGSEIESKAVSGEEQKQQFVDPLRKNFEDLAQINAGFTGFGTDSALADPYAVLRRKSGEGSNYQINNARLGGMIAALLQKNSGKEGVPIGDWMNRSGQRAAIETNFESALSKGAFGENAGLVEKALNTAGNSGGPTIRTDIEPIMREAYLRAFPVAEQIASIPSNGLVHTYNVKTATGEAVTVGELGDLTAADADSTFVRKANANIAIIASRRAISLKLQYASQQSGMNFNLSGAENTEVMSAITAIARKNQSLILQGNYTTASKGLNDEDGATDANGFDGLRTLLKNRGITKAEDDKFYNLIDQAVGQIMNAGGDVSSILGLMSVGAKRLLSAELSTFMRILGSDSQSNPTNLNQIQTGLLTVADTVAKMVAVPASAQSQGVGYYDLTSVATEDAFIVDPTGMSLAYLGSPNPVVLELPVGFNNALSNVYIVFLMNGLVLFIDGFHRKIRIPKQTV
jgi:hypothetical protein